MALKKYYSLLLFEAEEELSLLNFYIKSHEKRIQQSIVPSL